MPTPSRPSMDDLVEQTLWDGFWLPPWAHTVDRPELRYTWAEVDQPGLNQVCRVRRTDGAGRPVDLEALVAEVDRAHDGMRSVWLLGPRSQHPELPTLLSARGWTQGHLHHLRTLAVGTPIAPPESGVDTLAVCDTRTLTDCITVAGRAFEMPTGDIGEARIADELGAIQGGRVHRFVAYDTASGTPIGSGGLNTYPRLGIGFLWGGGTHPNHRGRGAYRALLSARLSRAAREGCTHVSVYARHDTSDPILARFGFTRHGTMQAWNRAPH